MTLLVRHVQEPDTCRSLTTCQVFKGFKTKNQTVDVFREFCITAKKQMFSDDNIRILLPPAYFCLYLYELKCNYLFHFE